MAAPRPYTFRCGDSDTALCLRVASASEYVLPGSVTATHGGIAYRIDVPRGEHQLAELAVRRSLERAVALHRGDGA